MKDIENSMAQSAAALARLERALNRLDAAAFKPPSAGSSAAPTEEIAKLKRDHATLKDATARVASRLDDTIARLAASLREG